MRKVKYIYGIRRSIEFVLVLALAGCTFGENANSLTEDRSLTAYLLAVVGVNGTGNVRLRFADGGTDGINQFTTAAGTVVLDDTVWFDIEKIDVYAGRQPTGIFPLASVAYYFDRFLLSLAPVTSLAAHDEVVTPAAGVTVTQIGQNVFVLPLSAGNTGNGQDSLGRNFFGAAEIRASLPPGGIQRIVVHVRRMQLSGTIGGNAFSVLYQVNSDFAVSPRCAATITTNATTNIPLYFDFSLLFRNVAAASSAGVSAALATNIPAGGILSESECFSL